MIRIDANAKSHVKKGCGVPGAVTSAFSRMIVAHLTACLPIVCCWAAWAVGEDLSLKRGGQLKTHGGKDRQKILESFESTG
jgi:hypothetical protein